MPSDDFHRDRARELRKDMTPAEALLWANVRGRRLGRYRFRRQQSVGPFYADFFCSAVKVIVELDGDSHDGREKEDADRQRWLEREGYRVLRFANGDIYENLDGVLEVIWSVCESRGAATPHPQPLSPKGRGELKQTSQTHVS